MTVRLEGLGLRHPGAEGWALRDVTLTVEPGEVLAVVGPSGSGKTTLLRLLCGLLEPTEGTVELRGEPQRGVPPERRPVAMVFQGFALFPHLTVRDNIAFGMRVRKVRAAVRLARIEAAAGPLGLTPLLDRLPSELSGGERQRTALARALVRDPALFCLDEPLSALDPLLRADARRGLAELLRADGRCAVLVTHDQSEAMTLGDRVAVLRAGRLEQVATPRELYDAPATPFVASFVGTPPMSLLTGADGVAGPLRRPGLTGPSVLGVRPEHVAVGAGDDAVVASVEDHGHEAWALLDTAAGRLVARCVPGSAPAVGTRVGVVVDPARVHGWPAP
ncbi:MAG: ABC transporter ATP-binding protein [Mycobacteriales bacterium]|nr:ABC transporter ATP-binding protein [Mycobacteriales bacterium]